MANKHVKICSVSLIENYKSKLQWATTSHLSKKQKASVSEDMEILENPCIAGRNVKWHRGYENSTWFSPKLNRITTWPSNFTPGYVPPKIWFWTDVCIAVSAAALFTIAKYRNNPEVHQLMNKQTKWGIYIQWSAIQPQKGRKCWHATCMNFEDVTISEISHTQKDKYCMIPFTWGSLNSQILRHRKENCGLSPEDKGKGEWAVYCLLGTESPLGKM